MPNKKLTFGDVVMTSRPFWWVITGLPFIIGYFSREIVFTVPAVVGALYFTFPYNLFLYGINDIYDYESDVRNPRKNSIEGALLDKTQHKQLYHWILLANVPFGVYFIIAGSLESSFWLLLSLLACYAYSAKPFRLKESPFLDSFSSALRYGGPYLFGLLLVGSDEIYWAIFAAIYLWSVGNHAFSAIQDIGPDREAGISSIATRLGATNTVLFCFFIYMLAAATPSLAYGKEGIIPTLLMVPYIGLVASTLLARNKEKNPVFHRIWQLFTYLNYPLAALLSMYLLSLHIPVA